RRGNKDIGLVEVVAGKYRILRCEAVVHLAVIRRDVLRLASGEPVIVERGCATRARGRYCDIGSRIELEVIHANRVERTRKLGAANTQIGKVSRTLLFECGGDSADRSHALHEPELLGVEEEEHSVLHDGTAHASTKLVL